jgi:hypothetical protein
MREVTRGTGRLGRSALVLALVAALALIVGGCCADDGSDCDSNSDCCSDYCDGVCVDAETARLKRATRDPSRVVAQQTQRPQAKFGLQCLKKKLAR